MERTYSIRSFSTADDQSLSTRNNTLKKKSSMRRRSSSRRSNRAGSVRSLIIQSAADAEDVTSAFYCPVPTSGTPTDVLVVRFQTWRKVLKDLISYFREIQSHYEQRSKSLVKLGNVANNISTPANFLTSAGIDDALQFLRNYHKAAIQEAAKAKEIEEDVILAITGLRGDLQQKIKEIKNLSGDFKNSVDREMDHTRKAVAALVNVLDKNEVNSASTTGKQDPYLLRLAVDHQVERQIDEENYLHQAYLNLESSGRELESIVVGEIQKAYNAYAGILKREADNAYGVVGELRDGPVSMPKDQEWIHFMIHDGQIVDPTVPMRSPEQIHYPGQDHVAAQEIRAGLLERKSKYLKSYTAGWYVLSTTHLHEFKSADKAQAPIMSLYLPEQKLGSHSTEGGASNKFILKGRQTGTMHRGHTWVFRAESHDTMMAWYEDIKALTEKTAEERSQFVRTHSRSLSQSSRRSMSSDGIVDEDDDEPFSANQVGLEPELRPESASRRPQPGGRFPSDMQVKAQRGSQAPQSPSSVSSGRQEYQPDTGAFATAHYSQQDDHLGYGGTARTPMDAVHSHAAMASQDARNDGVNPYTSEPLPPAHSMPVDDGYFGTQAVAAHEYLDPEPESQTPVEVAEQEVERSMIDKEARAVEERQDSNGRPDDSAKEANAGSVSMTKSQQEPAFQALPEVEASEQATSNATPSAGAIDRSRPTEGRTDSEATILNLQMPGKFPRGGGLTSP
ncbi:hypothetical protein RJ55_07796 [Drechmeria coniospora]|nr:hypothetical protein RJ55_07796 [Drechmeria coniospora]